MQVVEAETGQTDVWQDENDKQYFARALAKQLCFDEGAVVTYLPLYSPDFNFIEDFFAELKRVIE